VPGFAEFSADYAELLRIVHAPAVRSLAFARLELLAARFRLHKQLNAARETLEAKTVPHRDFYNVRKCDTHVHHSACMNQKHLLSFIKRKLKTCPDEVVIARDGGALTLRQVFESLNLTAYDLSVDTLDVHAHDTFQRFDRFNLKYNPLGQSRLREIFLKTDNLLRGSYLAELTREVLADLEETKYALAEYRLSIYGRARDEWARLAAWFCDHGLASPQVRWLVQLPRLYEVYRASGAIASFQDMLAHIFEPLFAVTLDPASDPKLHDFLSLVVGFDSVDDESKPEARGGEALPPPPAQWTGAAQPPYAYQTYYVQANLAVLNGLRAARGLTTFSFRPHCGEAGDVDHLAAAFLTAESVNHGINLRRSTPLQYLYYHAQIGLAISPLSNNRLFLEYAKSPFFELFSKGLNVSLSTDDPLMLSLTREPLVEEYAVASQVWRLSSADSCEIARMSVLQSGFEAPFKRHWLGANYTSEGPAGNDINLTNVPSIRLQFRKECLDAERALLAEGARARGGGGGAGAGGAAAAGGGGGGAGGGSKPPAA
jgi:AMP deaminase